MGGISTNGGDKLNIELNLVPFIDLLSALVLFLLITAVWVQISAIPASVDKAGKAKAQPETPATPPPERLVVHLTSKTQSLKWPSANPGMPGSLARSAQGFDYNKLTETIQAAMKTKAIASAGVSADEDVEYGDVVETIDAVKMAGIGSVAISTN